MLAKNIFYVYILKSLKDKKTYTGYTFDVGKRIKRHNNGQVKATKNRRPLVILFTEEFKNEQEAKRR